MDAASIQNPVTLRHSIHRKYRYYILILLLLSFFVNLFLVWNAYAEIHFSGWIIAAAIILYLILVKKYSFLKETAAALLFALGIWFLPLKGSHDALRSATGFVLFFVAALLNIITFSYFEKEADSKQRQMSLAFYTDSPGLLLGMIFVIGITILFVFMHKFQKIENVYFLYLLVIPPILYLFQNTFQKYKLYRVIGDVSFVVAPLCVLLVNSGINRLTC